MYAPPNSELVFIVQDIETDRYRLIECDGKIAAKLNEYDCLVDSLDVAASEPSHFAAFITTIRLQYGVDCKIKVCAGEYSQYGCIIYFEVTNLNRNKNVTYIT
jgi:hypothetical protein